MDWARFSPTRNAASASSRATGPRFSWRTCRKTRPAADRLFENLEAAGFDPWLDRRKLLPGQNWPRSIEEAIGTSDFFLACFSHRSVKKKGGFQAEIRYALDCTQRIPLDEIFLIPARLDACPVPVRIQRETQYIDLFPDWDRGFRRILTAMRRQWSHRAAA